VPKAPPTPSSSTTSARMRRQRTRDTQAELHLRRALYAMGLRYRIHRRPLPLLRREADIVFRRARVAVFVDGCFWHGCPEHGTSPKANGQWWATKLEANRQRDLDTNVQLAEAGWTTVRVWEHEDPVAAAQRVSEAVGLGLRRAGAVTS
jgi:DNA mismatch endonuclease (patch repair protein)